VRDGEDRGEFCVMRRLRRCVLYVFPHSSIGLHFEARISC